MEAFNVEMVSINVETEALKAEMESLNVEMEALDVEMAALNKMKESLVFLIFLSKYSDTYSDISVYMNYFAQ